MLHVETGIRHIRQSSHRTLRAAMRAASVAARGGMPTRITADATTLAALLASGAVYRTVWGEIIDTDRRWAVTEIG